MRAGEIRAECGPPAPPVDALAPGKSLLAGSWAKRGEQTPRLGVSEGADRARGAGDQECAKASKHGGPRLGWGLREII